MKGEKKFFDAMLIHKELYENKYEEGIKQFEYNRFLFKIRQAAYLGYTAAQEQLAYHYEDIGFWGIKNPYYNKNKKLYWFSKACDGNEAASCNSLAAMYENGEGCTIDTKKALLLYKKAADLGLDYAKKNYKIYLKQIKKDKD